MRTVHIFGGPEDGKIIALPDNINELKMALARHPSVSFHEDAPPSRELGYIQVRLPIRQRFDGQWVAVWREPSDG